MTMYRIPAPKNLHCASRGAPGHGENLQGLAVVLGGLKPHHRRAGCENVLLRVDQRGSLLLDSLDHLGMAVAG